MHANRIITIISLAFCLVAFVTTNSPLVLGFIASIVVLVAVSLALGKKRAAQARLSLSVREACTAGEEVSIEAELRRPRALRGRVDLLFEVHDYLLDEAVEIPVKLYPGAGSPERFSLPVDTAACGHIDTRLVSAYMMDPLGLARTRMEGAGRTVTTTVYPRILDINARLAKSNPSETASPAYDPRKPGQDRTEVFDMREFRAGDSLKSVHWKLSARFDDLMVREPARPTGYDVAILCGLHRCATEDPAQVKALTAGLSVLVSTSMALLRAGTPHVVAFANGHGLQSASVDSRQAFASMTDDLMCAPLQGHVLSDADEYRAFARAHSVTKTVVVTDVVDEDLFTKIGAHTSLTVLHVSDADYSGSEDIPAGTLIHIPAASLDRIKNLEL